MTREIERLLPEYFRTSSGRHERARRDAHETVRHFVDSVLSPATDWRPLREIYARVGAHEARAGRSLDGLHAAIQSCGQVASRRFIRDTRRHGWSLRVLEHLNDSLFLFLEEIASAAARGHASVRENAVSNEEQCRRRLRDLLVADPPCAQEVVTRLIAPAGWCEPRTIAAVALPPQPEGAKPFLPPTVLADLTADQPYLVVPDPDGPRNRSDLLKLLNGHVAAIGPTVGLTEGAMSLRWARYLLELMNENLVDATGPARCADHIPLIVAHQGGDLLRLVVDGHLRPLMSIPPARRSVLARTLLEYIKCSGNAVATAERLDIHEQTVRYRIRRLETILGEVLPQPDRHAETLLALLLAVEGGYRLEPFLASHTRRATR
ncbi:helix-turn-helix domain-containing protein [Actinomadura sp. SCN-SB]|uniref:helix-turn-helix domain-containing protein n=1 Tax=Actinomadura sp. SCN-SB TaxID=3373092 RepID=UPI003753284F